MQRGCHKIDGYSDVWSNKSLNKPPEHMYTIVNDISGKKPEYI